MFCTDVDGWFSEADYLAYVQIVNSFTNGNFAEVGCWKGRSFCSIMPVLLKNNYKNIYAIDHWMGTTNELNTHQKEATYADIFQQFTSNIDKHGFTGKFNTVRLESVEASKQFDDNFFDVVFIDGDHEYNGVLNDLNAWTPKVKSGGILCGHDVAHGSVQKALTEKFSDKWNVVGGTVWMVTV